MQTQILSHFIPVFAAVFAAGFVGWWCVDRSRLYILAFSGWFAGLALAISLQVWMVARFGPAEVVLFHLVSAAGLISLIWGIARRDGRDCPWLAYVAISGGTGIVLWFASANQVHSVIIMAQNFSGGVLLALAANDKWRHPLRHKGDRMLLVSLTVFALYSLFRPSIIVIMQERMTMAEYQASAFLEFNMAVQILMCLLLATSLTLVLVLDRMHEDREEEAIDALSGLLMRRAFERRAAALIARASERGQPVSLIVADIDHFKKINDSHGHVVGDEVIASFGRLLLGMTRSRDAIGRIGGEEFCVVVADCTQSAGVGLADRICSAVPDHVRQGTRGRLQCTASFGVAQWRKGESYRGLFERADACLYKAKSSGRNQVHPPMSRHSPPPDTGNVVPMSA